MRVAAGFFVASRRVFLDGQKVKLLLAEEQLELCSHEFAELRGFPADVRCEGSGTLTYLEELSRTPGVGIYHWTGIGAARKFEDGRWSDTLYQKVNYAIGAFRASL